MVCLYSNTLDDTSLVKQSRTGPCMQDVHVRKYNNHFTVVITGYIIDVCDQIYYSDFTKNLLMDH